MTVGIIVAALLGLGIGAGLVYWLMQQRLTAQGFQHEKDLRRNREDLERDFELRMQAAIEPIQRQRDRDVSQLQAEIARLRARSTDPASPSPEPVPTPAPPALPDPWGGDRALATPTPEPVPAPAPEPTPVPAPPETVEPSSEEVSVVADSDSDADSSDGANHAADLIGPAASDKAAVIAQIATWSGRVKRQGLRAEDHKQLQEMARLTRDRDVAVRIAAIEALGQSGAAAARPLLEGALRDPNLSVVRAAAIALDRCRTPGPKAPKAPSPKAPNAKPQRPDA